MSNNDRLTDLSALRDRLVAEVATLNVLISDLEAEAAAARKALARYDLGEVWGATKLARHLGCSRNTAHKLMCTELAEQSWTDGEGRLRVNAADVERWLVQRAA